MQEHPQPQQSERDRQRSIPLSILAGFSAIVLIAGGGTAWWTWHNLKSQPTTPTTSEAPATSSPQPQTSPAPAEQTVQIYWLKNVENRIELTPSPATLKTTAQPNDILKAAFEQMLQGSPDPTLASTIPQGTKLRSLEVKSDGIHVDLSQEFTTGGGSASMTGRVGQVIYTATTLDPKAQVWISVEGKPLDVLGGEGLLLDQPTTRESFGKNFTL
jgi:spore germination protein GerM